MLTVEDVMELPIMTTSKVRTSKYNLKDKEVKWVSVIETPVENFVRKNEFVLSTGIGCGHDPKLLKKFVRDVIDSEASALAFASGRYVYDISEDILELAESKKIVLIVIPWEVRFGDILQTISEKLNATRQKLLESSQLIQQQLLNLVLHKKGLPEIARYVKGRANLSTVIMDKKGKIRGNSHITSSILQSFQKDELFDLLKSEMQNHYNTQHPLFLDLIQFSFDKKHFYYMNIHTSGRVQGYLLIHSEKKERIPDWIHLLKHAVTAAALCFLNENAIETSELKLRNDFVLSLVNGEVTLDRNMDKKANQLGHDLSLSYFSLVGMPENLKEEANLSNETKEAYRQKVIEQMTYYIHDEMLQISDAIQRQYLMTFSKGYVIAFLDTQHGDGHAFVYHFIDLIERRINQLFPGIVFTWGIAKHGDGIHVFQKSYEKAKTALGMGRKQKGRGTRTTYEDTRKNRLLLNLAEHPNITQVTDSIISPLVKYNEKRGLDLIETFVVYNRNKGNVSQAARELNLHRQSLLYRLRKIETLTQRSLVDSDDLFCLDLSIRMMALNEPKTKEY